MQLDYGNWVRKKILRILSLCALVMSALILIPLGSVYKAITTGLFIILFVSFLFPLYAYIMFSQSGGKLQEKVYNIAIHYLGKGLKGDFIDNTFDGAISNLTFHEVKSVPNQELVLQEALRVVKSDSSFSFVDYLFDEKYYGTALE